MYSVSEARKWLDGGSVGYPTTFDDYDFTTIEPDERAVAVGRKIYGKGILKYLAAAPKIFCSTIETLNTDKKFDGILFNNKKLLTLALPIRIFLSVSNLIRSGSLDHNHCHLFL